LNTNLPDKVFAAFDDRKGPVTVFTTLTDLELANKIAVKSIVSTLSAKEGQQRVEGEAIIPFPEEDLLAFIYYLSLDQKTMTGDNRVISLAYLVPTQISTSLYENAELLSKTAKSIGEAINQHYIYGKPVSQYIQAKINHWGESEAQSQKVMEAKEKVKAKSQRKVNLYDLYNLLPPETGFRKYRDPIGYLILSFLYKVSVILSGPDQKLLADFTDIIQKLYPLKKLSIIQIEEKGDKSPIIVPNADIVILTDELLNKCKFSEVPLLLLNTYQDLKLLNCEFDEVEVKMISEWVKLSRENTDIKVITNSLEYTNEKLNQLKYLAQNYGDSTFKEVAQSLKLQKEELEFCARILLLTGQVTATELNVLFGSNIYTSGAYPKSDKLGVISF
jgi:hypothetical protein